MLLPCVGECLCRGLEDIGEAVYDYVSVGSGVCRYGEAFDFAEHMPLGVRDLQVDRRLVGH